MEGKSQVIIDLTIKPWHATTVMIRVILSHPENSQECEDSEQIEITNMEVIFEIPSAQIQTKREKI